jgi:DNA-directed RNA polymerase subunit M/transcription elongation factor TFIIS
MWKMKSCPRCNGDLYVDYDEDGMFNHCLQCGYVGNIEPEYLVAEHPFLADNASLAGN